MSFLQLGTGDRPILGTGGCVLALAGITGWIGLEVWLDERLGWPDRYSHPCHLVRGCWIHDLWFSPALLRHGGALEMLLFATMWTPILIAIAVTVRYRWSERPTGDAASTHIGPE